MLRNGSVGEESQTVEDGVLLLFRCVRVAVGLVEGLHHLLQDGLHSGPPLLPQASRDPHHRVGGAVPVGEDTSVQKVDAWGAPGVGKIDQPDPVRQGLGHVPEKPRHQVGVGIDDDDGVAVPARRLLPELVHNEVVHKGGLAHAGAGHIEVVPPEQVVGEVNGPGPAGGGIPHGSAAADILGRGHQHLRTGASNQGRLVPLSRRVPQCCGLPDSQDTTSAEKGRALWGAGQYTAIPAGASQP